MSGRATTATGSIAVPVLLTLALLAASAPLGIDSYLASFPAIAGSLATPPTMVQLTLTGFLCSLGLGQLFWGPISDRFGRRRPLLIGAGIGAAAALACAFAPTIQVLIAARFV